MADLCLVGYTFRGYDMARALELAARFGYSSVELRDFRDVDLTTPQAAAESLERAACLARARGLCLAAVWYPALPVSRDRERCGEMRVFSDILAVLADYGVPILHTRLSLRRADGGGEVVSAGAYESDYGAVQAALDEAAQVAEQQGVRIALEAHMGYIHDTAASLLRIVSTCGSPFVVGALDFANMLISYPGESLTRVVSEFGRHAGYTHLKNVKLLPQGFDWNVPLRWGDINYRHVLQVLKDSGYSGPLAVEYVGTGDPEIVAEDDAVYLKRLLLESGP